MVLTNASLLAYMASMAAGGGIHLLDVAALGLERGRELIRAA